MDYISTVLVGDEKMKDISVKMTYLGFTLAK